MHDLRDVIKEAKNEGYSNGEILQMLRRRGYSNEEISHGFGEQRKNTIESGEEMNLGDKIRTLFAHPQDAFEKIQKESIGKTFFDFFIITLIAGAGYALFFFIFGSLILGARGPEYILFLGGYMMVFMIALLAGIFVYSGLVHLLIHMLGGEGNYSETFFVIAYSNMPGMLTSIIPYIGSVGYIYSMVIAIFGLSKRHNISGGKAFVAVIIPPLIIMGLFVIFILFLFLSFARII